MMASIRTIGIMVDQLILTEKMKATSCFLVLLICQGISGNFMALRPWWVNFEFSRQNYLTLCCSFRRSPGYTRSDTQPKIDFELQSKPLILDLNPTKTKIIKSIEMVMNEK